MARDPAPHDRDDQPWLAEGVREERSTLVPRARLFGGALFAVLLAVLVALGVYLASGHKSDGSGGYARPEDAPLIGADAGAYKVQPANPGGAQITGIDDSVAAVAGGRDVGSAVLPDEPEEPVARPAPGAAAAAPPAAPPTDLLPATIPPAPVVAPSAPPMARAVTPAPVVAPKPSSSAPAPAKSPATRSDAARVGATPPEPAKAARVEPAKPKPAATTDPLVAPPAAALPATAARPPAAPPATAPAGGSVTLQLGAFSTREKADAAWATAGAAGALGGLTKRVEPVDRDGATLYRLRAAGVASRDAAKALCGRIKAAGNACIVAE